MDQEQMRAYWRSAPAGRLCPWEQETTQQWTARARKATRSLNQKYDVSSLCTEFSDRLSKVVAKDGDRLRK
jgi:hypothetical protein